MNDLQALSCHQAKAPVSPLQRQQELLPNLTGHLRQCTHQENGIFFRISFQRFYLQYLFCLVLRPCGSAALQWATSILACGTFCSKNRLEALERLCHLFLQYRTPMKARRFAI